MRLQLSDESKADLQEIGRYIRRDNAARAASVVAELTRACRALTHNPRAYPLIPRYEKYGLRRTVYGRYLIFYRLVEELVMVVRIIHGARDYDAILFRALGAWKSEN